MSVHNIAKSGFNTANDLYDRARPSYQANALSHIRSAVKAAPPLNVVEIGSGTGLFTSAFIAHPEWKGAFKELRAVEPSPGMREVFSKKIGDERVSVAEGHFQDTSIPDAWADVVVIAQAFHWCPDYDGACKEFARILKPGGVLALCWNLEDRATAKWVAQVRDCIERFEAGSPQYRLGLWRAAFDTTTYKMNFEPPAENSWEHPLLATKDLVIDRAMSKSYTAILSDEQKTQLRKDLSDILDRGEERKWINEAEGTFEYPYKTDVVISRRGG
ncbi:S-adenosyl-L-methionine-dependent methyltransferase [Mycena kentingensis (nom. inval.)]|nr:S-adenosyl-L-methionine-dependent methyltransferase [Mycena kentingensis (nom. inval.)]